MPAVTTPSGQPVTCGAPVEAVTPAMRHPVPLEIAHSVYGKDNRDGDLACIVRAPPPDGSQPGLELALLAGQLYERARCRVPGCDGTRCHQAGPRGAGRQQPVTATRGSA